VKHESSELHKIRLIGEALGDALGYPIEFMRLSEITKQYGNVGVLELEFDNTA
jgi:ADP-ribosylglycohydrolase